MPSSLPVAAPRNVAETPVRVLLVDDQLIIVEAIRRMLAGCADIEYHYVTEAGLAAETAERLRPTVILQDLVMPGVDGFALIRQYRDCAVLGNVPVIVLSSKEDPKLKAHSFAVGANDYLIKLPDRLELLARLRYHSCGHTSRIQRDEAFRSLAESQRQLAEANIELQQLAALDGLTGIANRRRFDQVLRTEWQRGQREQRPLSLLMCDIDHFKAYNDGFGHPAGDQCLKRAAAVLTEHLKRPADLAARYGGEEFSIVLTETDLAGAMSVAEECRSQLAALAMPAPNGRVVSMSIGVASVLPSKDGGPEQLIARADQALYAAKAAGRDVVSAAEAEPISPN